jgi:glycosyltransferase involved in cell wall biosynthesis
LLRVLTFGRFADRDFGGLERYVFELGRALRDEAQFVNIVAARGAPPDTPVTGQTVYARPIGEIGGVPLCPGMLWAALRLHRERPFDIVHLQFPADPMAHAATAMLPRSVKRVITWHSDIVRQTTLRRFYRPFLDRLLQGANAIIVPTPAHLSSSIDLKMVCDPAKFSVVPFGFDFSRFRDAPPLASEIRARYPEKFLVFALGRHVYYKGFEYLIRALPLVPEVQVLLGGRGPLSDDLRQLAEREGVRSRIDFLGRIPEADLPAYYHACDVFCMPSVERSEAFGIVQLEAMACGRPVVCCELNNGVTWVNRHGETGLVVPPADVQALASALRRLSSEPDTRHRLGAQARRRALDVFNLENMRIGTLEVYRRVLSSATVRPT